MIKTLEYKGQEIPMLYNYYCTSRLKLHADNIKRTEDRVLSDVETIETMLYYAIEAGCEFLDKPFKIKKKDALVDITKKDVAFILGHIGAERISELLESFMGEVDEEEDKKK